MDTTWPKFTSLVLLMWTKSKSNQKISGTYLFILWRERVGCCKIHLDIWGRFFTQIWSQICLNVIPMWQCNGAMRCVLAVNRPLLRLLYPFQSMKILWVTGAELCESLTRQKLRFWV